MNQAGIEHSEEFRAMTRTEIKQGAPSRGIWAHLSSTTENPLEQRTAMKHAVLMGKQDSAAGSLGSKANQCRQIVLTTKAIKQQREAPAR